MTTTNEYLTNKYGIRMNIDELIAELKIPYNTLMQKRSRGTLPFNTHRDGMKVFAFTVDVADHLDHLRVPG